MKGKTDKEFIRTLNLIVENDNRTNQENKAIENEHIENLDLLTAVEHIVELAKWSKLNKEFFIKAERYLRYVDDKLELTPVQSVFMALFIDNSDNATIKISDFGDFLNCGTTRMLKHMTDIDVLEKRELVRCNHERNRVSYSVPIDVIEAFKKNEKYVPRDYSGLSCQELFEEIGEIFDMRKVNELTYENMVRKINCLFDHNKELMFVQNLKKYELEEDDEMLLVLLSHLLVNNSNDSIESHDIAFLYDGRRKSTRLRLTLSTGAHPLLRKGLIEYKNDCGFVERDLFCITRETKETLFSELNMMSLVQTGRRGDMIKSEDIVKKEMYYDEETNTKIKELVELLDDMKYNKIRARLKDAGFRCGFTCLFYGMPGTGKTETVLQLARLTGRDIMQVNISQIKSKWVGDSEKNIKLVFESYKAQVKGCEKTPILLFNEADAIIGKRKEGADGAVDKMENSIQNIILQEMETLDGILIATTNLAQNMDKAFERRFLYKIKFEKPTVEARMNMWKEMIPRLNVEESHILASRYEFSGGQIENIARHYTIGNILHGESESIIGQLCAYCNDEKLEKTERKVIGFSA